MSDLAKNGCPEGTSRRFFLKTAASSGTLGALVSARTVLADGPKASGSTVPRATLGRTGEKVTILGMGTSWALSPSFVQAALFSGVRYIDTSETYENTRAEKIIGDVLDRTKMRKDVYLVTKNTGYRKSMGTGAGKMFEQHLNASLARLKTDHVDCYYMHGLSGNQIELLHDPNVKAAFEALKKQGKTRFCGLSATTPGFPRSSRRRPTAAGSTRSCSSTTFVMLAARTGTTICSGPSTRP